MFELLEDHKRDFHALADDARDALNVLMRVGGPEYGYASLAIALKDITPRFNWTGREVQKFINGDGCKFFVSPFAHPLSKKPDDFLKLDDMIAIRDFAADRAKPILEKIAALGESLVIPTEVEVSTGRNDMSVGIRMPGIGEIGLGNAKLRRSFNFHITSMIERLADIFKARAEGRNPDPMGLGLSVPLTGEQVSRLIDDPDLVLKARQAAKEAVTGVIAAAPVAPSPKPPERT